MTTSLSGNCQCGAVRFHTSIEPLFIYACHCRSCQQRTGSAFSMGIVLPMSELHITGPCISWARKSSAGHTNTRYSCEDCGNVIYGIADNMPDIAKLQAGLADNSALLEPDIHIWTQHRQHWLTLPTHAVAFEQQPSSEQIFSALEAKP